MNIATIKEKYAVDSFFYDRNAKEAGFELQEFFLKNGAKYARGHYNGKLVEKKVYGKGRHEKIKLGGVEYLL